MTGSRYPTEYMIAVAKKVLIEHPRYMDMDGSEDANGFDLMLLMYSNLGGLEGAQWRQVHNFIAVNFPSLVEKTPSPDTVLRRCREVKKDCKDNALLCPVMTEKEKTMLKHYLDFVRVV